MAKKARDAAADVLPQEVWRLDKIKPYPNNPRTHPPAQVAMLAELLKKYGADQPIVVDERGVILKGHGRRQAALAAGMEEFPVVVRRGLSPADKSAMRIQDNQVALLSGWDNAILRGEIGALSQAGFDLALLGFGEAQLVSFTTMPQPPSEFPEFGEDVETQYCCPRCNYRWSGKPNAGAGDGADLQDEKSERPPNGKAGKDIQRAGRNGDGLRDQR